jgi:hypothetical protein
LGPVKVIDGTFGSISVIVAVMVRSSRPCRRFGSPAGVPLQRRYPPLFAGSFTRDDVAKYVILSPTFIVSNFDPDRHADGDVFTFFLQRHSRVLRSIDWIAAVAAFISPGSFGLRGRDPANETTKPPRRWCASRRSVTV